jgi:ABC-2 type transport system permease protein
MKALMTVDPLSYGVDALRNVVFSGTAAQSESLADVARSVGLVRWPLAVDVSLMAVAAAVLTVAAAVRFSRAE